MTTEEQVEFVVLLVKRCLEEEESVANLRDQNIALKHWIKATERFVLEGRGIGEHRTVRDAVRAENPELKPW